MNEFKNLFLHPVVIGHRGFRAGYPENTMAGFKAAMDAGVPMIELDVHLTRDNQPVVIHDARVDRTTNGKGRVCDFTLKELRGLDAGKWFHPSFSGERVPVLEDVLEWARGCLWVNVEIKPGSENTELAYKSADCVAERIKAKNAEKFTIVSSFDEKILRWVRHQFSGIYIGVLTYKNKKGFLNLSRDIEAVAWHPDHRYMEKKEIQQAKNAGLKILPYTVNTKKDIKKLLERGVDGFFTDDPLTGLKVISAG